MKKLKNQKVIILRSKLLINRYNPKIYSDTDSDEFLSLSEDEADQHNDYVNPATNMIHRKLQWNPVPQKTQAPDILNIPFVTAQNMQKLMFYPSGHKLNVPHNVRNMSALGHFRDITHSYPKPQKPKKNHYFVNILDPPLICQNCHFLTIIFQNLH